MKISQCISKTICDINLPNKSYAVGRIHYFFGFAMPKILQEHFGLK